ncbi:hypothetical protein [Mycetocola saprophilus]|uniref:hypothetical protein n=1 Tax=Mycetocola saprophilus TaxID=76636 RepID=UPI0012DE025D|nr:hypothetical protein [Mycetocola saprophilus]
MHEATRTASPNRVPRRAPQRGATRLRHGGDAARWGWIPVVEFAIAAYIFWQVPGLWGPGDIVLAAVLVLLLVVLLGTGAYLGPRTLVLIGPFRIRRIPRERITDVYLSRAARPYGAFRMWDLFCWVTLVLDNGERVIHSAALGARGANALHLALTLRERLGLTPETRVDIGRIGGDTTTEFALVAGPLIRSDTRLSEHPSTRWVIRSPRKRSALARDFGNIDREKFLAQEQALLREQTIEWIPERGTGALLGYRFDVYGGAWENTQYELPLAVFFPRLRLSRPFLPVPKSPVPMTVHTGSLAAGLAIWAGEAAATEQSSWRMRTLLREEPTLDSLNRRLETFGLRIALIPNHHEVVPGTPGEGIPEKVITDPDRIVSLVRATGTDQQRLRRRRTQPGLLALRLMLNARAEYSLAIVPVDFTLSTNTDAALAAADRVLRNCAGSRADPGAYQYDARWLEGPWEK